MTSAEHAEHAEHAEVAALRDRLREAEETLDAIRGGGVDSLVIGPPERRQVYTLSTADRPYRLIVAGMGEGAATISAAGAILYANARLAAMVGRPIGQLVGTPVIELAGPADREALRGLLEIAPGGSARGQLELSQADGTAVPVVLSVHGLDQDAATFVRCMIATDLTAVREAERIARANAALREQTADLERRVAARTAELAATTRELEQFVYSVSHDLRAPLRAMIGFSQTLVDRFSAELGEKGRYYADRVRLNGEQMAALLESMLQMSQLSFVPMRVERVDLSQTARAVLVELDEREPDRRVTFTVQDGVVAPADADLIRSVLQNLLNNAWKFTGKKDQARIEFGTVPLPATAGGTAGETAGGTAGESAGGTAGETPVGYFVRDNGAGFDPRYTDRLFQPFQRLHTADDFAGTGMGLASVRRIIDRHGGRIWAEGDVNRGATFYFTLNAGRVGPGGRPAAEFPPQGSEQARRAERLAK